MQHPRFRFLTRTICAVLMTAFLITGLFLSVGWAQAPVTLRIGHGPGSDVTLLLMKAHPAIAPNLGKKYDVNYQLFRGTETRFKAYIAGAIDGGTGSANSIIFAASQGVEFKAVASISQEGKAGFNTSYFVLADSPIKTIKDLQGKTIGINGFKSSIHLWARMIVQKAGLNPDRDVKFSVVKFSAQGKALRAGKIDVAAFVQPFFSFETRKGDVRKLFTSKDAVPFDEELMLLYFKPAFLKDHPEAVRAFCADFVSATNFYVNKPREARQIILENKLVRIPPDIYFAMEDFYRDPNARINIESLRKMQEAQLAAGFQKNRIDPASFVDLSYLPK